MVQLGKFVKGKVTRQEARRQMIRIQTTDQTLDDIDKEQILIRQRRDNLKTQMVEE